MSSAAIPPAELHSETLSILFHRELDSPRRRQVEQVIYDFLVGAACHGYNEVCLGLTFPTPLENLRSFDVRGALRGHAVATPAVCSPWKYSVHTSNGARSRVLLTCHGACVREPKDGQSHATLVGLSHIMHDAICEAMTLGQGVRSAPGLTGREIDSLNWIARGKTASEIALIIGISRRTVESYISTAMRKLGASTRSAAAVKAYGLGLLNHGVTALGHRHAPPRTPGHGNHNAHARRGLGVKCVSIGDYATLFLKARMSGSSSDQAGHTFPRRS